MKIILYTPRKWTRQLHKTNKRWNVIVAHRRSGKTTATLNHLIRDAMRTLNARFAFIAPTYKQAKNIAWDILKEYAGKVKDCSFNESELRADFSQSGSRITLYGADNPDALRGMGLWGVVFDEYSQQPSNIFTEIIRPALSDHKGYAIWIGTPKGKNEFYRLYNEGLNNPKWLSIKLTVDDTGLINEEELNDAKAVMNPDEFDQEWYCSFEASIKGAYYADQLAKLRADKRLTDIRYDERMLVHTVWDLGVGDSMAIGFFQRQGNEMRMIDYYEDSGKGLNFYKQVLDNKGYIYGSHFAPHDIEVRELSTGRSRKEIASDLGINFKIVPKLSVDEGINAGRLMFPRLWIDQTNCLKWLDYISQYRKEWDDKRGCFKRNPLHDFTSHAADMYRYAALIEDRMSNEGQTMEQYLPNYQNNSWLK